MICQATIAVGKDISQFRAQLGARQNHTGRFYWAHWAGATGPSSHASRAPYQDVPSQFGSSVGGISPLRFLHLPSTTSHLDDGLFSFSPIPAASWGLLLSPLYQLFGSADFFVLLPTTHHHPPWSCIPVCLLASRPVSTMPVSNSVLLDRKYFKELLRR